MYNVCEFMLAIVLLLITQIKLGSRQNINQSIKTINQPTNQLTIQLIDQSIALWQASLSKETTTQFNEVVHNYEQIEI